MAANSENSAEFCQILFEIMAADRGIINFAAQKSVAGILLENILGKEKPVFKNIDNLAIVESA